MKDKVAENMLSAKKKKKTQKDSLRNLCNNIKCNNICIIGIPVGEERQQGIKKPF